MEDYEDDVYAFEYLDDCNNDVSDFISKVEKDGYLRIACLSHLKRLYSVSNTEDVLDRWIKQRKGE